MDTSKKRSFNLIAISIGILLTALITAGAVVINYSLAKYTDGTSQSYTVQLQDFDVGFSLTYTNNGTTHTVSDRDLSANHGILRLSPAEYNSLKMDIDYTGEGMCYCRFRITESWQHTDSTGKDVITPKELSAYTLDSKLYDGRSYDGYIYYAEPLKGENTSVQAITACAAGSDAVDLLSPDDAAQFVDIAVEIQAAQWNQAKKLWGLTKFPWE